MVLESLHEKLDPKLLSLAHRIRQTLQEMATQETHWHWVKDDLGGACGVASIVLVEEMKKLGFEATVVIGRYLEDCPLGDAPYRMSHCWVRFEDFIIDLTATQFNGIQYPIYVISKDHERYIPSPNQVRHRALLRGDMDREVKAVLTRLRVLPPL